MGGYITCLPGHGNHFSAAVAMDCSPAAVAKFKYPAVCMAHRCPGHPYKGPLYYSLHTVGTLPANLHPAFKTHL